MTINSPCLNCTLPFKTDYSKDENMANCHNPEICFKWKAFLETRDAIQDDPLEVKFYFYDRENAIQKRVIRKRDRSKKLK